MHETLQKLSMIMLQTGGCFVAVFVNTVDLVFLYL